MIPSSFEERDATNERRSTHQHHHRLHSVVQWVWAHGDDSLLDTVPRVDLVTAGLFRGRMRRLPVTMMAVRAMTMVMVMVMAVVRCVVERREIEARR